ncbi:MAG: DUF1624 domain-containing protein, partial [Candidatus Gastranaerophilales bacterium]|nr:DUF1624 domain-containing protein [Candidatus Gastranaerophilales bacterium]
MTIFEKEEINTGRQTFLDIAKTLAICGMIFEHSTLAGVNDINNLSPLIQIITLLFIGGVFAAPVFMFAMGVGISYSHRSTPKYNLKRGINLTLKAWGLNIIRYALPAFILLKITQNTIFTDKLLYSLYSLDILQFAGLAFFVFALFSFFKLSPKKVFGISISLAIIG